MLLLPINEMVKNEGNYYSLVVGIAKRAREIAQEAEENKIILTEKPVQLAIEDFRTGRYKIKNPPNYEG